MRFSSSINSPIVMRANDVSETTTLLLKHFGQVSFSKDGTKCICSCISDENKSKLIARLQAVGFESANRIDLDYDNFEWSLVTASREDALDVCKYLEYKIRDIEELTELGVEEAFPLAARLREVLRKLGHLQ
jgi:hypothetical protein